MTSETIIPPENPEYTEIVTQYEKKIYDLKQLLEISRSLCSTIEFSQLIESILYTCMGQFRVLGAGIFVLDALDSDFYQLDKNYNGMELKSGVNYQISATDSMIQILAKSNKLFTLEELRSVLPPSSNFEPISSLNPSLIVPLVQKNHLNGILLLGERITMPDETDYSADEKEQISIISSFLDSIKDSPVYEKAKEFLTKEEAKLQSFRNTNTNSANYSRILFMGAPEADIKNEIWDKIYKAMGTNAVLQIEYTSEGKTKSETYKVQPYQLIFDNGIWELWAYCLRQKHEGMRLFNLSRISSVGILELAGKFVLPKNYTFKNFVVGNFGCFNDENPQIYKIKFHKDSYAWLYSKDRIWGAKQTIEECDDGYILSFEASQFKPILRWILGWGKDAEPLEPADLVKCWKDAVHEMAEKIDSK